MGLSLSAAKLLFQASPSLMLYTRKSRARPKIFPPARAQGVGNRRFARF